MRFDKPKGQRLNRYFFGVCVVGMWWVPSVNKWVEDINEVDDYHGASTFFDCKTMRAFKRHLRKNPEIKGLATLRSRYIGHDVYA